MKRVIIATILLACISYPASARPHHHRQHAHARHHNVEHRHTRFHHHLHRYSPRHTAAVRHGNCNGYARCRCGVTAAHNTGLPLDYHGFNLKQARDWKSALPHIASPVTGAVVYQHSGGYTGHVSVIRSVLDRCRAVVSDDKGTYSRNICGRGATYLAVN